MPRQTTILKWLIILPLLVLVYLGIDYALRQIIILPGFLDLEEQEAHQDLRRCTNSFYTELHHLEQQAADWAEFDDMYQFVVDSNSKFIKANLQMEELSTVGIDSIYVVNSAHSIVWRGSYSRKIEEEVSLQALPQNKFAADHPLIRQGGTSGGVLLTDYGPLLLASHRILPTSGEGSIRGTLIMGKFLLADIIAEMRDQVRINFDVLVLNDEMVLKENEEILSQLSAAGDQLLLASSDEFLHGYSLIKDIHGKKALLIKAQLPRTIMARGRKTAIFTSVIVLINFTFVLLFGAIGFSLFWESTKKKHALVEELVAKRTAELQESEERFSALSHGAFDAIFLTGKGVCILQNSTANRLFGYSDEELIGRLGTDLIAPDYRERVRQYFRYDSEKPLETVALRKDGTTFPAEIQARKAMYKGNRVLVVSLQDISWRKYSEQKRLLLEEQLRRLERMEAVGQMAGGVAHDLNNLLSGVVAYPEILLNQIPQDSQLRKPLESTREAGMRAADVVADLLTVARGVSINKEIHNLNDIITEYVNSSDYTELLQKRYPSIALHLQLAPELPNILCSPVHIRKCLRNLITNGSEMIEGAGEISVASSCKTIEVVEAREMGIEAGEYCILKVSDTGSPLSEEARKHIFDPYYSKKELGRSGTGLEMAVVWNSVKDHHGSVTVTSTADGSVFTLYLPVTEQLANIEDKAEETGGFEERLHTILVVDDEALQRDVAVQILKTLNYSAIAVSSGEEALDFLKKNRVDLVILDMLMEPGMGGVETLGKLREIFPSQKVIIASGFSKADNLEQAKALGVNVFLKKPYTIEQLEVALKNALR